MKRNLLIFMLYAFMIAVSIGFGELAVNLLYWKGSSYLVVRTAAEIKEKMSFQKDSQTEEGVKIYAQIFKNGFAVKKDGEWQELFVKGVNMEAGLSDKWSSQFSQGEKLYYDWLTQVGKMKANTIRAYALLPPEFYSALEYYNEKHSEAQLWLLQEIRPKETSVEKNRLKQSYVEDYYKEIKYTIDALHGHANIAKREEEAYGTYKHNVSRYVLGYLIGRKLELDEVIETNKVNEGFHYKGEYLSADEKASPTEAWLAMSCDYVLKYETETYSNQHPVAIVSWPVSDAKAQESVMSTSREKKQEYNDKGLVDMNHILTEAKMEAGFFGAYPIYPSYSDFVNAESQYDNYRDEEGRFRYGGYLKKFIEEHSKHPVLVTEFGRDAETEKSIMRMMKTIEREGYAGGIINTIDTEKNAVFLDMESEGQKNP